MAAHNFAPVRALDREFVILSGKGTGAGAANLTSITSRSGISSIVHKGSTGKYTVTMDAKYREVRAVHGSVIDPTAVDDWVVVVEVAHVADSATFDIAVFKGGALTDLTSDEILMLTIIAKNTSR